jgi:hypothetical protein
MKQGDSEQHAHGRKKAEGRGGQRGMSKVCECGEFGDTHLCLYTAADGVFSRVGHSSLVELANVKACAMRLCAYARGLGCACAYALASPLFEGEEAGNR